MPHGVKIFGGIGQFHVHGHISQCFPRFSPNFIPGAGAVDGEVLETLWNKINAIAGSTSGMSSAHRREVIDDHMNDSNWMKLTRISSYCCPIFQAFITWFADFRRHTQLQSSCGNGTEPVRNGGQQQLHFRCSRRLRMETQ